MAEELLRRGEFARRLGVSSSTVQGWLDRGRIRYIRLPGGERRIPEGELARILAAEHKPADVA